MVPVCSSVSLRMTFCPGKTWHSSTGTYILLAVYNSQVNDIQVKLKGKHICTATHFNQWKTGILQLDVVLTLEVIRNSDLLAYDEISTGRTTYGNSTYSI